MDSALRAHGVYSSLVILQHVPHAFRPDSAQKQEMLAFLNQRLTGCGTTETDDGENVELPSRFELKQNYPNPFNPTTEIGYQISVEDPTRREVSHVTLKVYDVLGREVATLASGIEHPGIHEVVFVADNLPSGVYFVRLTAGAFVQTRKAVLMK